MKHTVIGTAGHIDHGKTMLLKALTGIDADRLPEEKARGMTIDLGFVFFGKNVAIIDVPGHEKFIKNMLAGVSTIDLVIFVIAADDGIMPQTKEHLEILHLLEIKNGIIALTKIDLVDKEWLELVKDEIAKFVEGTFLENAPIIPVSGTTGEGLPEFKEALLKVIDNAPAKSDKGIFRLWIDRVFMLKGIGTIVTGTVLSGTLKVGDKLELLPQGEEIRARKIQVHNEEVEECHIGERVGINIIGVELSEIKRGNVLAESGYFNATSMVNAKLYLLKDAKKPLKNKTRIRFHVGTIELLGRLILLNKKVLNPGESTFVQFRLEVPVSADRGDHYIIRSYSPVVTIGGGTIVEVHTQKLKYLPGEELKELEKLENGDPKQILLYILARSQIELKFVNKLTAEISVTHNVMKNIVVELIEDGVITVVMERPTMGIVLTEHLEEAQNNLINFMKQYHQQFPLRRGLKQSELKTKLFKKIDAPVFDAILAPLIAKNMVKVHEEVIFLSNHTITFTPNQEEIKNKIEELYFKGKYVTPSEEEVIEQFLEIQKNEIMNIRTGMIELGILIEIKKGTEKPVIFHAKHVEEAENLLVDILKKKGEIKLFEFREMINSTRKFTLPLLLYFDSKGVTERDGDVRRLKN